MGVVGFFSVSDTENRYVLVVMEYFSMLPEIYAIPYHEARSVVGVFVNNCVCRYGVPLELHADHGRHFESAEFMEMCQICKKDWDEHIPKLKLS